MVDLHEWLNDVLHVDCLPALSRAGRDYREWQRPVVRDEATMRAAIETRYFQEWVAHLYLVGDVDDSDEDADDDTEPTTMGENEDEDGLTSVGEDEDEANS